MRCTALLVIVAMIGGGTFADEPPRRPNVLFIAVDDLNDWVGPLGGHPQALTPAIDRLAARGVTFANAHCQAPICNPSRASLMTGLRPSTTGVYALGPTFRTIPQYAEWVTLPQYLQRHGYRTMTCGKIYHNNPKRTPGGAAEFDVIGHRGGFGPTPPRPFVADSPHPLVDWGVFPERVEQCGDWPIADWAIEQLRAAPKDQPFMLCVGFHRPHVPLYAPQAYFDRYPLERLAMPAVLPGDRDDTPRWSWYLHWKLPEPRLAWVAERRQWANKVRAYLACVSFVDEMIGRVVDALDEAGLADNTVIVLWSDHGYHLGEKLITGKNTLWRESTRVPLIIVAPGIKGGATCDQPTELLDIYPTLVELCGLPERDGLDGVSLAPQLADPTATRDRPAVTTHGPGNHSVVNQRYRYIRYADGSEELYDHATDPREWHNRAADPALAEIKADLAAHLPRHNAPPARGPGHTARLLEQRDGAVYWQGKIIDPDAPVPAEPSR